MLLGTWLWSAIVVALGMVAAPLRFSVTGYSPAPPRWSSSGAGSSAGYCPLRPLEETRPRLPSAGPEIPAAESFLRPCSQIGQGLFRRLQLPYSGMPSPAGGSEIVWQILHWSSWCPLCVLGGPEG